MFPDLIVVTFAACATAGTPPASVEPGGAGSFGGLGRRWTTDERAHQCVTPETRALVLEQIRDFESRFGPVSRGAGREGTRAGPVYPFWPQAGNYFGDLTPPGYMDDQPGGGFSDFFCADYTSYDGHAGIDVGLRSFEEQLIGVPVFSAADGTVLVAVDGEDDMHTFCEGSGNYVIVNHGSGREGWYFHLKKGSVAVSAGEVVKAGQQIGQTASSGCSYGPHLHFGNRQDGVDYDPNAGACRAGASGWADQPPHLSQLDSYLFDFGVTTTDLFSYSPGPPYRLPTHNQVALDHEFAYYWLYLSHLNPDSTWRTRFIRPNGTTSYDSGTVDFDNLTAWGASWFFFYWWIGEMHSITGTWRYVLDINGITVVDAPVLVVATIDPGLNRAPGAIAAAFDPAEPAASDVIFARVSSSLTLDDLDWDLVRYRYVWKVNGSTVRDVTNAAMSDAIPRDTAENGDELECTITPSDGKVAGTPVTIALTVGGDACIADCDENGTVNTLDFLCYLNRFNALDPRADCDGNGTINTLDFLCFLNAFTDGC